MSNQNMNQSLLEVKFPPHSPDAEAAFLGCVILDPENVLTECLDEVNEEYFYLHQNKVLFRALLDMYAENKKIDLLTIKEELEHRKQLTEAGGFSNILGLPDKTPSAANYKYYLGILKDYHIRRKLIQITNDFNNRAFDGQISIDSVLVDLSNKVTDLLSHEKTVIEKAAQLGQDVLAELENAYKRATSPLIGEPVGYPPFDNIIGGLRPSEIIIVAARPSIGKTTFALNLILKLAQKKHKCGFISLEMSSLMLSLRLLTLIAKRNFINEIMRNKGLSKDSFAILYESLKKFTNLELYITDNCKPNLKNVCAVIKKMASMGIKYIFIDYIQLIFSGKDLTTRNEELSYISSELKRMAKQFNVVLVVISQLNRNIEKEKRKPIMSDIRDSGAIEQDADVIMFLHKEPTDQKVEPPVIPVTAVILKNRNGMVGECEFSFNRSLFEFDLKIDREVINEIIN